VATVAVATVAVVAVAAGTARLVVVTLGGGEGSPEFDAAASGSAAISPFAGTAAAAWGDGEAALAVPPAVALDRFTASDVEAALRHTRRLLVTANLDLDVVLQGDTAHVVRLLGPRTVARLEAAISQPTPDLTASAFLTRFPDGIELAGPVIKVTGAITVLGVDDNGLRVATEHLYAYPTRPSATPGVASGVAPGVAPSLILVRRSHVWEYQRTTGGITAPELVGGKGTASTGQCLENDRGYIWPPFAAAPGYSHPQTVAPTDLWDLDAPLPARSGCPA